MPTPQSNIVQQLFKALCAVNVQHDDQAGKLPCGLILEFSAALGTLALLSILFLLRRRRKSPIMILQAATPFSSAYISILPYQALLPHVSATGWLIIITKQRGRRVSERAHGPSLLCSNTSSAKVSRAEPKLSVSDSAQVVCTLSPRVTGFCEVKRKDDAMLQNNAVANGAASSR